MFLFLLLGPSLLSHGQSKAQKKVISIVEEGEYLYRLEMASWHGTDLFLEHCGDKRNDIQGYFSYPATSDSTRCVFFGKGDIPKIIGNITFDKTFNLNSATINIGERGFTEEENSLYIIRQKALAEAQTDTLFKYYKKTNLNFIPLVYKGEKKVYILTGPIETGVVIFGNDYLLTFDKKNNLRKKKSIHNNIIFTSYEAEDGKELVGGMHSHLPTTGDFITPTDVCTLMLYSKYTNWEQYYVISENYVTIWDCKDNEAAVLTREAFNKISNKNKSN
ncbi:hypothetical protein [Dysgonomonas sp. PH5-37]|uniref:hypothetical protein n=1 Tax=Dysgonomonas sp. PH5-37 TaxID=2940648 RepID=UPI0024730A2E|nr:hypothetical protein [Dysgonomonas sp. PH5-37]